MEDNPNSSGAALEFTLIINQLTQFHVITFDIFKMPNVIMKKKRNECRVNIKFVDLKRLPFYTSTYLMINCSVWREFFALAANFWQFHKNMLCFSKWTHFKCKDKVLIQSVGRVYYWILQAQRIEQQ